MGDLHTLHLANLHLHLRRQTLELEKYSFLPEIMSAITLSVKAHLCNRGPETVVSSGHCNSEFFTANRHIFK